MTDYLGFDIKALDPRITTALPRPLPTWVADHMSLMWHAENTSAPITNAKEI